MLLVILARNSPFCFSAKLVLQIFKKKNAHVIRPDKKCVNLTNLSLFIYLFIYLFFYQRHKICETDKAPKYFRYKDENPFVKSGKLDPFSPLITMKFFFRKSPSCGTTPMIYCRSSKILMSLSNVCMFQQAVTGFTWPQFSVYLILL